MRMALSDHRMPAFKTRADKIKEFIPYAQQLAAVKPTPHTLEHAVTSYLQNCGPVEDSLLVELIKGFVENEHVARSFLLIWQFEHIIEKLPDECFVVRHARVNH